MKYLFLSLIALIAFSNPIHAQSFYAEDGKAVFYSKVPLHNFSGTSKNLTGKIDLNENTVDFYIDLETLDTGNGKRDKDMRKTLKTDKYPYGEFFGNFSKGYDPDSSGVQEVEVSGVFKIHGKEKEITVSGTIEEVDEGLKVNATWILNLKDYEIKPPKLLFVKVDEKQEIVIDIILKPES